MAALIQLRYRQRRLLRRNRIFRDRTNPLDKFNDLELFWQFRFRRADILQMTNELKEELEHLNHRPENSGESLPTLMNINSSSNGLSRTAPVPHFCFCLFLVVVVVVCCLLLLFVVVVFSSLKKKSFFMSLNFSRTWSGVRTHTRRLLAFLAISFHNWLFCWFVTSLFKVL